MCLTGQYKEHGIKGLHGFCSEYSVSDLNFLVRIPEKLANLAVLLEPMSVAEKAVLQIFKIQERIIWKPKRALVRGAGPLGLLTTILLQTKGLDVTTSATRPKDSLKARVVQTVGAEYVNSIERRIRQLQRLLWILDTCTPISAWATR